MQAYCTTGLLAAGSHARQDSAYLTNSTGTRTVHARNELQH